MALLPLIFLIIGIFLFAWMIIAVNARSKKGGKSGSSSSQFTDEQNRPGPGN